MITATDSRGVTFNPLLQSVQTADGAVFQVIVTSPDGVESVDLEASSRDAAAYIAGQQ